MGTRIATLTTITALALAGCGGDEEDRGAAPAPSGGQDTAASTQPGSGGGAEQGQGQALAADFVDGDRQPAGSVRVSPAPGGRGVVVEAEVRGLEPGFHGFHVHEAGACEPPKFESAKGHVRELGQVHGEHDGDLPSLFADESGNARLRTVTDRLTIDQFSADDGVAVMVHAGTDNFADIPSRYGEPDEETENTGDAGSRVACATFGEPGQ